MIIKHAVVGELETNAYIVSADDTHCVLVDPGADGSTLARIVKELELIPTGIIFTHGHLDHLLGAEQFISACARKGFNPLLFIHELEAGYTGPGCLEQHSTMLVSIDPRMISQYSSEISRIPRADHTLRHGDVVAASGLEVIHTPGHSPGSICLYNREHQVLFSGDTLFYHSVGRTDLPGGNDRSLAESLGRIIALLPDNTKVYPGHGPMTSIKEERKHNPFIA